MKYSEFEKDVEAMGYSLVNGIDDLYVKQGNIDLIISVGFRNTYIISSDYEHFRNLEDPEKERLLVLAWRLASTPPEERGDEKKYRLRLPFVKNGMGYLTEFQSSNIFIGDKHQTHKHKTAFTESEIEELKATYNLDSFILEEVREDERGKVRQALECES